LEFFRLHTTIFPFRKEKLTAEHAETAEFFLEKTKNRSLYRCGLLFAFGAFGDEDIRMNEEDTESAEIVP
jgi:hypothetical protein